jgi:tetratricopeptide (TPR) repeat protein
MKRIVFLLLLFFFCVTGSAVCAADTLIKSRDSIILLIAKTQGSRKADLYLNLAERLRFSDPMGSFRNIENALKVSIAEGYIPGKAEAHFWMASYFSSKRKFTLGLENYLTSLELFRKCNDRIGQMRVYEEIGNLNRNTKNHETGIFYFQTGLNLARTEKNYRMEGVFLERLGVSYQLQENYSLAMVLFEQSITSYRKAGDKAGETSVINCIGSVLMDQKNYDEALSR